MLTFLSLALILLPVHSLSQTWELIKNKDGIKVYTSQAGHSNVKQIMVDCVTAGTIEKAISIFQDIEQQPQWVYSARSAHIIKQLNENNFTYYVESSLPWPVVDRYLVAQMTISKDDTGNILSISTTADSHYDIQRDGMVRIRHFIGKWTIKKLDKDRISINYVLDVNPGGSLPASITNLFISRGPYRTMSRLNELLKN